MSKWCWTKAYLHNQSTEHSQNTYQLLTNYHLENLADQGLPLFHLVSCLALFLHFPLLFGNWILARQEKGYLRCVDRKALLDRDLARPFFIVSLALNKDETRITGSVPTQTKGDRTGRLVQTSVAVERKKNILGGRSV